MAGVGLPSQASSRPQAVSARVLDRPAPAPATTLGGGAREIDRYEAPRKDVGITTRRVGDTMIVEKIVEVPTVVVKERPVPVQRGGGEIVERWIDVPKIEYHEHVIEREEVRQVERIVEIPQVVIEDRVITVPRPEVQERIIEVPKIEYVEKIEYDDRIEYREVPVDTIVEVPEIEYIYKPVPVEVPEPYYQEVPIEKLTEVPVVQVQEVERIEEVPVMQYRQVPVYKEVIVPIMRRVEQVPQQVMEYVTEYVDAADGTVQSRQVPKVRTEMHEVVREERGVPYVNREYRGDPREVERENIGDVATLQQNYGSGWYATAEEAFFAATGQR